MKKLASILVSSVLLVSAVACSNVAKTNANAPNDTTKVGQPPEQDEAQTNQGDATSDVRRDQLNSDIRAREQRNDATGGDVARADGDLESEVRSKLEANLPASQLAVKAKDGAVTISGTVPTQPQYDRIQPLAQEIKGVKNVVVNVEVVPAQPDGTNSQGNNNNNNNQPNSQP